MKRVGHLQQRELDRKRAKGDEGDRSGQSCEQFRRYVASMFLRITVQKQVFACRGTSDCQNMRRSISAFVRNNMSGRVTQELCQKAQATGAAGIAKMANAGRSGANRNTARDVLRSLRKHSKMPPLYWADIPMSPKPGKHVITQCPFLLPSEVLEALYCEGALAGLCGFSTGVRTMLDTTCKTLGSGQRVMLSLSLITLSLLASHPLFLVVWGALLIHPLMGFFPRCRPVAP